MSVKVLIIDDGYHDESVFFEDGSVNDQLGLIKHLALPHEETYEVKVGYVNDLVYKHNNRHEDFTFEKCESIIYNMVEHLSYPALPEFKPSFDELWSMAY